VTTSKPYGRQKRLPTPSARTSVTFLGPVDDAAPCYAAADLYVQPTFYDPCSLVVLEALASGLPVITSRYNGVAELLTPGREGFVLHDPADVNELASRLEALLDPQLRRRCGDAARRLALDHTFDRNCDELVAIYRDLAPLRRQAA
jgi:UDP-glucose:(heptosyl)LPS alpha-1,3-glucosyltransferase